MTTLRLRRDSDSAWTLGSALLGLLALLITTAALVAHVARSSWQPLIVLAALAHPLLLAAPFAVVLFVLARRWFATATAVLALLLTGLIQAPLYIGSASAGGGTAVTVLQANLRLGSADPAALVRTVRTDRPDVLTTEEITPPERDRLLAAGLGRELPYRFDEAADGGIGVAIWSRFPLSDDQDHIGFALGVLSATVQLSSTQTPTVFAVHLLPPYPYRPGEWGRELARLEALVHRTAAAEPVIVAGDFNSTTDNAQFRSLLSGGFHDASEQSGAGYLATYPGDRWFPAVIAIDHVLADGATAQRSQTVGLPGSDHRGLLVRLRLSTTVRG